jgi:large subunit ribosomal protein L22
VAVTAKKKKEKTTAPEKATSPVPKAGKSQKGKQAKSADDLEDKGRAVRRNLRVSPRKLRLLANLARGKDVQTAIETVRYSNRKLAVEVVKLIRSAVNNATQKRGVDLDKLYVKNICVDQGPTLKRFMARARGSGARILKRSAHLTVVVGERQ